MFAQVDDMTPVVTSADELRDWLSVCGMTGRSQLAVFLWSTYVRSLTNIEDPLMGARGYEPNVACLNGFLAAFCHRTEKPHIEPGLEVALDLVLVSAKARGRPGGDGAAGSHAAAGSLLAAAARGPQRRHVRARHYCRA